MEARIVTLTIKEEFGVIGLDSDEEEQLIKLQQIKPQPIGLRPQIKKKDSSSSNFNTSIIENNKKYPDVLLFYDDK